MVEAHAEEVGGYKTKIDSMVTQIGRTAKQHATVVEGFKAEIECMAKKHAAEVELAGADKVEIVNVESQQIETGHVVKPKKRCHASCGAWGRDKGGHGGGSNSTSWMTMQVQAQADLRKVKHEKAEAQEDLHDETMTYSLFIDKLQTQIEKLKGLCREAGVDGAAVAAATT